MAPADVRKVPSVESFEKRILQWDFYKSIQEDSEGTFVDAQKAIGEDIPISKLPARFETTEEYISSFYPIFLLECRQSIQKAKKMEMEASVLSEQVHAWTHSGFTFIQLKRTINTKSTFTVGDLILLVLDDDSNYENKHPAETPSAAVSYLASSAASSSTPSSPLFYILAIVDVATMASLTIKIYLPEGNHSSTSYSHEMRQRSLILAKAILEGSRGWFISRILNLATMYREYQSLISFPDLFLKDAILCKEIHSKDAEPLNYLEIPSKLKSVLQTAYNKSQWAALMDCMKTKGITLIQGPPGTGKTATIIGILSVLLNATTKAIPTEKYISHNSSEISSFVASSSLTEISPQQGNLSVLSSSSLSPYLDRLQPWIFQSKYTPWYDEMEYTMEELEQFNPHIGKEQQQAILRITDRGDSLKPWRILVCAPSNAGIDEILKRLTLSPKEGGGIFDETGKHFSPSIIRVGPNIHPDLAQYSLEYKASQRMKVKQSQRNEDRVGIKHALLKESQVVCATQSVCGSRDMVSFHGGFDTVVIDEASQGVELSTLIPLRLGCQRLILVGDPRQLSATVISKTAIEHNYNISLFQRLEGVNFKVNILSTQYRMHPEISRFPSTTFYNSQLKDAENILQLAIPPFPWNTIPLFKPLVFFTIDSQHVEEGSSLINTEEAFFAVQLLDLLRSVLLEVGPSNPPWTQRVAIISPYSMQVQRIRRLVKSLLGIPMGKLCPIDVNTVDGFQGREKDFVIFSAVRAHFVGDGSTKKKSIGFLADERRMNVALTRARLNLWVIGNGRFLMGNPHWCQFWKHCCNTETLFNVNFERLPQKDYLKRWLCGFFKRQPEARKLLSLHVPNFLNTMEREMAIGQEEIAADTDIVNSLAIASKTLSSLQEDARILSSDFSYTDLDEGDVESNVSILRNPQEGEGQLGITNS